MSSPQPTRPSANISTKSKQSSIQFKRVLTLTQLVLFGVTFVGPTAPFPVFGIVSSISRGHMALAYLIAMAAMLLTALSYARMAEAFPVAGSAYSYASRTLHPLVGFLAGWLMLLDYSLIPLMSVIYGALTASRFIPQVPYGVWLVLFGSAITLMNWFGLKVTNRANFVMTAIMGTVVVYFASAAILALRAGAGEGVLFSTKPFYNPDQFSLRAVMAGTSIAVYSYLGFDGISTLAEDSYNPKRDIGRATVLVCLISAIVFVLQAYLGQLVWPDFTSYPRVETAFLDVSRRAGGAALLSAVSFVLLVACVASAVTSQASASRLLFGMSRDRLLPPRVFAYIHPRYSTPTYGVLVVGVVSTLGGFLFSFQLAAEAINFGALLGFISVNSSVISHYFVKEKQRGPGTFRNFVLPLAGCGVCLYIFANLSITAKLIGATWCAAGMVYAAVITGGFRRGLKTVLAQQLD
jgi:putrescine importer